MSNKGSKSKKSAAEVKVPRRAKQLGLGEQYEGKKIAAIDEKADLVVDVESQLARLKRQKKDLDTELAALVTEHGLKKYKYVDSDGDTFVVTGNTKTTVKVRREKRAKAKDDE